MSKFQTGHYVMLNKDNVKKRTLIEDIAVTVRGLKIDRPYKILRGIDAKNPGTIGIEVNGKLMNYSLFLFKPLSEEESRLAELLGGL